MSWQQAAAPLSIPDDTGDMDVLTAALAYAEAGWYVGPLEVGGKHPGSLLGKGWQHRTSRDSKQLVAWFAGGMAGVGVFLHAGRSGAVIFDVDRYDAVPTELLPVLAPSPHQSTRADEPGRGHYVFRKPPGRCLGNGTGKLGKKWGEVRGLNGVIVVSPTPHPDGGRYEWLSTGEVPVLPDSIAALLPDGKPGEDAATEQQVAAFVAAHNEGGRSELLSAVVRGFCESVAGGGSRHDALVDAACWAARESRAGLYPARLAFDTLQAKFVEAMGAGDGGERRVIDRGAAVAESNGIVSWAVSQALSASDDEIATIRSRVASGSSSEWSPSEDPDEATDGAIDAGTAEDRLLPAEFWAARPALNHIRRAAHSRIRSPDLVFHGVLARLSAYTKHTVVLPDLAGSFGSLNYFALAIGPSGAGKSSGSAIADELLTRPDYVPEDRPLGTGEGLAENYMGTVTEQNEEGAKVKVRRQTTYNCFVYGDEGAALTEMMDRKGTTLPEALRRAWTGSALGQSNATSERTRVIPGHRYRLGLLIGFQPEIAAKLMADDVAGTPQRFIFASAVDPTIPDAADLPEWPGELVVPKIGLETWREHEQQSGGYMRHVMTVDDAIATEVRSEAVAKARGTSVDGALDAHRPLHLLKVAGMLAILDGRLHINLEDWALADTVWRVSCRVRAGVLAAVRAQEERAEAARVARHAAREHAAEAARGSAQGDVRRLATRLTEWLHSEKSGGKEPDHGHPRSALRKRLNSSQRHLFDPVVSHGIDEGWIAEANGRYWAGDSKPAA